MLARNLLLAAVCLLAACGGGGGGASDPPSQGSRYRIGGTVSGLNGSVVLQLNNVETLTVANDGAFTFAGLIASGAGYQVAVTGQPSSQQCSIASGSGTASGHVSTIRVECINVAPPMRLVTGNVSGLSGTLVLNLNEAQPLLLSSNGTFSFVQPLQQGTPYRVSVAQQPFRQVCELSSANGTVGPSVPAVMVTCVNTYLVGFSYSGVRGDLVVQNNGAEERTLSSGGSTMSGTTYFSTPAVSGAAYDIRIRAQPSGQQCTLSGGTGVVATSDAASALIVCETIVPTFTVGGAVAGLNGTLRLRNAAFDELTLSSNGAFTFGTAIAQGSPYNVTIESQPPTQRCAVSAGSGVVEDHDVTTVAVSCANLTPHTLGGRLIGVTSPIVLRNNGANALTLANDGTFTFTDPLVLGTDYEVTASSADANQMCHVARGVGAMPDAAVANISVVCSTKRPTRFVYVANEGDQSLPGALGQGSVSQYSVGVNGALTALSPATVAAGTRPLSITADRSGRFVYVRSIDAAATGATSFWQYSIDPSGALVPMSTPSVSAGNSVAPMTIDPRNAYAYAARGQDLLRFAINADGSLGTPTVQNLAATGAFRAIAFDRAGERAYITGLNSAGDGVIHQFSVESDGSFTPMSPATINAILPFVFAVVADPFDRFLYAVDNGFSRIVQYARTENGALTALDPAWTWNATMFPSDITTDPFGRTAYTAAPGSISMFLIDSAGPLITGTPDAERARDQETLSAIAVDLAGEYMYVTASLPSGYQVHQYSIGADGVLTRIDGASLATGPRPLAIAVVP